MRSRLMAFLLGAGLFATLAFTPNYFEISKQLELFTNVFKEVSLYYVDDTQPGELAEEAINSMLSTLDPYTNYIPEEAVEDYRIQQTGDYGGIGASMTRHEDGSVVVSSIYEGFAAQKADIKVGDRLQSVNGESVAGRSIEEISEILKGAPGTEVAVEITSQGKTKALELIREKIHLKSVPYSGMVADGYGYISLSSFTQSASSEIKNAWQALKKEGELKGLILDLRNNPGGLLSEAINVSNLFIDQDQVVVKTKGKLEEWQKTYKTPKPAFDLDLPVVVLINSGSASASEIVAGTLQDYDRGLILGRRSFGKGLVQESRMLPYGAQLKVTIAKYYTPSGRLIQAIDYAERAEDGSVAKIPDSLRSVFYTQKGRPVYDGGGIDPDIESESNQASPVLMALFRDLHIFDYATEYYQKQEAIGTARNFKLSDADFANFKAWLAQRDFNFEGPVGLSIEKLKQAAQLEEGEEKLAQSIAQLEAEYQALKSESLDQNKKLILQLLQEEIAARYYFEAGRLANALNHDNDIEKALYFLQHPTEYQAILSGPKW